jgi:hypothetical protein
MNRRVFFGISVSAIAFAALLAACGDRPPMESGSSTATVPLAAQCAEKNEGCPCDAPGITVSCGQVERRSGDYVACSEGTQTCHANGRWGACIGDGVVTRTAPATGLHAASLGNAAQVCDGNPCDPFCKAYNDTPSGLDAGAGFAVTDAGLGLAAAEAGAASVACTSLAPLTNTTMTVTSISPVITSPVTSAFATSLLPAACYSGAFSPLWSVNRYDLGVVSAAGTYTHVVPVPATVTVTAYAGSLSTTATVTVNVAASDVTGAPLGYGVSSFTGAVTSAEAAPAMLYPYASTVFPLGLSAPLVMWKRAASATAAKAVMVTLRYPSSGTATFKWSAVIAEGSQRYQIPQSAWAAFDQTAKGSTGAIDVQRIDSANKIQAAITVPIQFATANLRGRIFYTEYQSQAAVKVVLPYGSAAPTNANTQANNCGVCHSLSADGSKFVSSSQTSGAVNSTNTFAMSNVSSAGVLGALGVGPLGGGDSRGLSFAPITRTGSYVLLGNNWWGNVNGGSNATTAGTAGPAFKIYQLPASAGSATDVSASGFGGASNAWGLGGATPTQMYAPQFSPDNTRLVFVNADGAADASGATAASRQGVSYFQFDEAAKKFSGRKLVVKTTSSGSPASTYVRWPSWEIDSRSVMFQTAATSDDDGFDWYAGMLPSGCCGRQKVHGKLWSIDTGVTGGSPTSPVALTNLNAGLGSSSPLGTDDTNRNYQPTMLPIAAGGFRWTVFTSVRAYGNLVNNGTGALNTNYNKLWVAAIDDATSAATDRSHPGFFLPNQDVTASTLNERGYWTLDACKAPDVASSTCSSNEECCGYNANPASSTAECRVDQPLASPATFHCKATSAATCRALTQSCSSDSDCCGFPTARCASGACANPPPITPVAAATYTRDYAVTCLPDKTLVWRFFDWKATMPSNPGASIVFGAATASTLAGLPSSAQVSLGTQSTTNASYVGADVGAALAAGSPSRKSAQYLRIFVAMNPSTDTLAGPTLNAWRQAYDCVDTE